MTHWALQQSGPRDDAPPLQPVSVEYEPPSVSGPRADARPPRAVAIDYKMAASSGPVLDSERLGAPFPWAVPNLPTYVIEDHSDPAYSFVTTFIPVGAGLGSPIAQYVLIVWDGVSDYFDIVNPNVGLDLKVPTLIGARIPIDLLPSGVVIAGGGSLALPGYIPVLQADGTFYLQAQTDVSAAAISAVNAYLAANPVANVQVNAGYLLNGFVQVQDAAQLRITDDLDIRWSGTLGSLASGGFQTLAAKQTSTALSWQWRLNATGKMQLQVSADGTTVNAVIATCSNAVSGGSASASLRCTRRRTDGVTRFFIPWASARTQTGNTHTGASARTVDGLTLVTNDDIGKLISGSGIPDGTTIQSLNSPTSVHTSVNSTAANTGIPITIGAIARDGTKWQNVGTDQTTSLSGAALYTGGSTPLTVGALGNGTTLISTGTQMTGFELRNGIDALDGSTGGTLVASPIFSGHDYPDLSFVDLEGNTWVVGAPGTIVYKTATITRNNTTVTVTTPGSLQAAAGGWGSMRRNPITGWFHVDNFGPLGVDPATWTPAQTGVAIRAARDAAAAVVDLANHRGTTLFFSARTYETTADTSIVDPYTGLAGYCAIKTYDYVTFQGSGFDATTIKLTSGANSHVFGHPGRLQSSGQQDQIFNVSWQDLTIDGNKSLQNGTHQHDGLHIDEHPGLRLRNVHVINCDGQGYYSTANGEFSASSTTTGSTVWTTNTAPSTIVVASTTNFPASGTLNVLDGGGNKRSVTYTSITGGTTFNGVTLVGGVATAGTVAAGSPVSMNPGVNIVRPVTITDCVFENNAKWGAFCSATNRDTSYKGMHAYGNGSPQARLAGKTVAVNLTATGTLNLLVDNNTQVNVSLASGDTPAAVVSKINTALGTKIATATNCTIKRYRTTLAAGASTSDAVFDGAGNLTSAAKLAFTSADVGQLVISPNVPRGTKIATYVDATHVTLTNPGTAGSNVAVEIGTNIILTASANSSTWTVGSKVTGAGIPTGAVIGAVVNGVSITIVDGSSNPLTPRVIASNSTGTVTVDPRGTASLATGGQLLITSDTIGGVSQVYLVNTSNSTILTNLGLTTAPANGDNNYRVGSNEYGGVYLDHSECVVDGLFVDSNYGDGAYIHNVNACHYKAIHATRNSGYGIYADAMDHSTGMAWVSMMNCPDFGVASYRTATIKAECYFDNGTEGYGVTHDTTIIGFNGPGAMDQIGNDLDNRFADYSIVIANGVHAKSSDPLGGTGNDSGFDIVFPKYGDGGILGYMLDNR